MNAGRGAAAWSVVLGLLATATMPVAIVATRYSGAYELLHAAFAIPVAVVLGLGAILVARRSMRDGSGLLSTPMPSRAGRLGRALGTLGVALASSALVSVAVYGVLTYLGER